MPLSREDQLAFWQNVAESLARGQALIPTLERVQQQHEGDDLARVVEELVADIREGVALHAAMVLRGWAFSECECAMIRGGEASGQLDIVVRRIVDGIQDGSFPLPGTPVQDDHPVHYWRALARLLTSGVSPLEALRLVGREVAGPTLRPAAQTLRQSILDGRGMVDAMRHYPDTFPAEVCRAVATGEQSDTLAQQAFHIAAAYESGSFAALASQGDGAADAEEAAATAYVADVIRIGVEQTASDIHFDPTEDGSGRCRLRVDGQLRDIEPPPQGLFAAVVRQLKANCNLDLDLDGVPQEGRIWLRVSDRPFDLRVSVVPTVCGERLCVRILDRAAVCLDLDRLGLAGDDLAAVRSLCALPHGIVIANGPAGSGKTTLLYSLLHTIDRDERCVLSVEDPVEYHLDGVAQTQVDAKSGLSYARALRGFLRQDPDVILVGEIRDLETAVGCAQAAITGHLVLTTLHANTSPGALVRLIDIGLEPFLVNSAVAGVISQRLVRSLCPACKQPADPPLHSLPPAAVEFIQQTPDATFHAPQGCDECKGTGYRGRTAIHEILVLDDAVRQAVASGGDMAAIRNAALASGMKPMLVSGLEKAARGITSLREVLRVVPHAVA